MALPSIKNSVGMAVTAVADAGVGTITLGSALSGGYQTAATAYGANANIDIRIEEGDTWEICRDCTYTHSGTTVTRGTLEDGSSGTSTRVAFTTAAKVYVIEPAARIERAIKNAYSIIPGGRLTLTTNVPVTTSDVTGATTVYYTPYVHNVVTLWDGNDWVPTIFTQKDLGTLSGLTTDRPYDVFCYLSAGELVLESLIWTSATVRATGISLQDGRYCKTGDKTRLYLGTFAAASATTVNDSEAYRGIWNMYNQVQKRGRYAAGSSNHTYTADSTTREYNGTTNVAIIKVVRGLSEYVNAQVSSVVNTDGSTANSRVAIGVDASNAVATGTPQASASSVGTTYPRQNIFSYGIIEITAGFHIIYLVESNSGTDNLTADYAGMQIIYGM